MLGFGATRLNPTYTWQAIQGCAPERIEGWRCAERTLRIPRSRRAGETRADAAQAGAERRIATRPPYT